MAAPHRRTRSPVVAALSLEPASFELFQAVRLLELEAQELAEGDERGRVGAVGLDHAPRDEVVRFRGTTSFAFPASEIQALESGPQPAPQSGAEPPSSEGDADAQTALRVASLGFLGPMGVLPQHYTELVLERLQVKDAALRDFLDILLHRSVSLFHRAWKRYRLPFSYETCGDRDGLDPVTRALYGLVGLGSSQARARGALDQRAFLYFAGHFARTQRSSAGLARMLTEYLGVPVSIETLVGRPLRLQRSDRTRLGSSTGPREGDHRLGQEAMLGDEAWDVQSRIRLHAGPISYEQYTRLLPGTPGLARLCELVGTYVGDQLSFEARFLLEKNDSRPIRLGSDEERESMLGWNTFMVSSQRVLEHAEVLISLDSYRAGV